MEKRQYADFGHVYAQQGRQMFFLASKRWRKSRDIPQVID